MSASYSWDSDRNDWAGLSRTETAYSPSGELLATYNFQWSSSLWAWIGMFKYEYVYDDAGRAIEQTVSRYNTTISEWYYDTRTISAYDQKGRTIQYDRYLWENNRWYLRSTEQTIYDDNSDNKLREQFSATYSETGEAQTYKSEVNYYHCDPKYTITVQTAKEGVGEVTGGGVYTYYARPQIAAIEEPGCNTFNQWNDGNTNATRRILVTEDKTYTAEFTPVVRTISASVKNNLGGSVRVTIENSETR